jgi:kynurenine formamidase
LIDRGAVGVGIDTLSLDFGPSKDFAFHVAMLKANKYQIENMANLDALPVTGATVIVAVLPVLEGSQAQARILALLP